MTNQVSDDFSLLKQMMKDLSLGDALYAPTNYWAYYETHFLPELRKEGLHNFRRRKHSVLGSFGATDFFLTSQIQLKRHFPGTAMLLNWLEFFSALNPLWTYKVPGAPVKEATQWFYDYVNTTFGKHCPKPLSQCGTSLWGNPPETAEIDSSLWTITHLQYCSMVANAFQRIQLKNNQSIICELGPGMGRNIEVLAQLYPQATFILFEIPPQLYVLNQYLTNVFPERTLGYREAISLVPTAGQLPEAAKGKIVILPTWRLPVWSDVGIDLFWNSASFQEMEPSVVRNYLKLCDQMRPEWIYINALPQGNYWGTWSVNRGGTKEPVTNDIYKSTLSEHYALSSEYATDYFLRHQHYTSYIFRRKS